MHELSASFVLGFHGCDRETGETLLLNEPFEPSVNDYDWLGHGIYLWEANPDRAFAWAQEQIARSKSNDARSRQPFVVGAVIDLGYCLDLISSNGVKAVEEAYQGLATAISSTPILMPVNTGGPDAVLRRLDCAVVQFLHESRQLSGKPAFDTVRAVFTEGEHIYAGSGFRRKTHTQICVRNPEAIKGVFRVADRHFTELRSGQGVTHA